MPCPIYICIGREGGRDGRRERGDRERLRLIDYEELAHAIMENKQSRDLASVSLRPRKADDVAPVQVRRPEQPSTDGVIPSLRAGENQCPAQ